MIINGKNVFLSYTQWLYQKLNDSKVENDKKLNIIHITDIYINNAIENIVNVLSDSVKHECTECGTNYHFIETILINFILSSERRFILFWKKNQTLLDNVY